MLLTGSHLAGHPLPHPLLAAGLCSTLTVASRGCYFSHLAWPGTELGETK